IGRDHVSQGTAALRRLFRPCRRRGQRRGTSGAKQHSKSGFAHCQKPPRWSFDLSHRQYSPVRVRRQAEIMIMGPAREEQMSDLPRRNLMAGLLGGGGLLLPGRRLHAQEQDAIVAGSKQEGALGFATSVSAAGFPKFMDAFKAKYPFLDITSGYYS